MALAPDASPRPPAPPHDHAHGCTHKQAHKQAHEHAHEHAHDHEHAHAHAHAHHHHGLHVHGGATGRLRVAFFLILVVLVVEVGVALVSGSLALLADAGHVLTDIAALGLSWFAVRQAERPADASRTYGYHRTGILVALFNSLTLILIAVYILHEAYNRFFAPVPVQGALMMIAAWVGLVVNLYVGWDLSREGGDNLNIRSAILHVIGDAVASLGVIIAAALIWWRPEWTFLDPAIAVAIAVLIAVGAWQIVRDATGILMEEVPGHIDAHRLADRLRETPGVDGIHDLHVWSIASGLHMLTCHVLLHEFDVVTSAAILNEIRDLLRDEFGIDHCTLQPEWELCGPDNLFCTLDMLREPPGRAPVPGPPTDAGMDSGTPPVLRPRSGEAC